MAENYCTKTCSDCYKKEQLNCPGCKFGPGQMLHGTCEIAKCCRAKGHTTCATCVTKPHCGNFRNRDNMPDYFLRKQRAEEERKTMLAQKSPFLAKWLSLLFWLVIPSIIAGLLTGDTLSGWFPSLAVIGHVLSAAVSLAYCAILWVLRNEDDRYRTAAKFTLLTGVASAISAMISGNSNLNWLVVLISLVGSVLSLIREYNEYHAHAAVASLLDCALSEKWEKLWAWHIGTLGVTIGGSVLLLIFSAFGILTLLLSLAVLAGSIGIIVVSILKLVYLYQTAQLFRDPEI